MDKGQPVDAPNEIRPNVCLLNDNTISTAHSEQNAPTIAAQFFHAVLFHRTIALVDHLVVNSPAFRRALQTYPTLLEVLDTDDTQILIREETESLLHLHQRLVEQGKFHPSHTPATIKATFDILRLDEQSRFRRYKLQEVAEEFDSRIMSEGFRSEFARTHLPENVRHKIIDSLQEIKEAKPGRLLGQSDFERASRPTAPLEEKLGEQWKPYEDIIFQIERAYYSTAIGGVVKCPFIFSPAHTPMTEVLGKPNPNLSGETDKIESLTLACPYLTVDNLLQLPSEFFIEARDSGEFKRWLLAMEALAASPLGTRKNLEEAREGLRAYLLALSSNIKAALGSDAHRHFSLEWKINILEGFRSVLVRTGKTLRLDPLAGVIVKLAEVTSGLPLLTPVDLLLEWWVSHNLENVAARAETSVDNLQQRQERVLRQGLLSDHRAPLGAVKVAQQRWKELDDTFFLQRE
jgi:hypothetical protein